MSSIKFVCLFMIGFVCKTEAYGEYVPESVYSIDEDGYESEPIYVRNKRELEDALSRFKRGGGAYSYSGSYSSSGGYNGGQGVPAELANIQANVNDIVNHASTIPEGIPNQIFSRFADFGDIADSQPIGTRNGGGNAYSYSGSTGSGYGSGYSSGSGHSSNLGGTGSSNLGGAGHQGSGGSSTGPNIFSRSGVEKGKGIKVSSAAQGPNAAFSSSSTSSDGQGNVKYHVKSGQY